MRKTFLYPAVKMLKNGNIDWLSKQAWKYFAVKYLRKIYPDKIFCGPAMGVIVITYRCNSRCPMCSLSSKGDKFKELSTKEIEKIIDDLIKIGVGGISFTGGEPLVREDIFHLLKYCHKKGTTTTLNTNGLLLNDSLIDKLILSSPDNINISLDSADEKTYDLLRGTKNGLSKLEIVMKKLSAKIIKSKKPITLTAVTTVSDLNSKDLTKIARLAKKMDFHKIGFNPLHDINKEVLPAAGKDTDLYAKMRKIKKIIALDNTDEFLKMFDLAAKKEKFPLPCLSGYTNLFIDGFGDVFYCWPDVELGKSFANVKKTGISALWKGKEYDTIRKNMKNCRQCFWNCQAELSIIFR